MASPTDCTALHPSHIDPTPKFSPRERVEVGSTRATTPLNQPPTKRLAQANTQKPPAALPPPFGDETNCGGPHLPTNKRPSTAATNEPEFFLRISQAPRLQRPCPAEHTVGEGALEQRASEPHTKNPSGKRIKKDAGQAQASLARTGNNERELKIGNQQCWKSLSQEAPPRQSIKPALLETHRTSLDYIQSKPKLPKRKNKTLLSMILPQVHLR